MLGWTIVLYAFSNSYYGASSLINAFGGAHMEAGAGAAALIYGICWISCFISGPAIVYQKRWAMVLFRLTASVSVLTLMAGTVLYSGITDIQQPFLYCFVVARPVPELFLLLLSFFIMPYSGETGHGKRDRDVSDPSLHYSRRLFWSVIIAGAILPWLVGLSVRLFGPDAGGLLTSTGPKDLLIYSFMTIWFDMPFICLALFYRGWLKKMTGAGSQDHWFQARAALTGGLAGAAATGIYVFIMMWRPILNSFFMAISPPFMFAGTCIGMSAGWIFGLIYRGRS